jgi:chaperonin GroES
MLRPISDRVLIKRPEEKLEKTAGGLFVPEKSQERPLEGVVVAVGPGRYVGSTLVPLSVKVGDKVLLSKYSGTEVILKDQKMTLLKEEEILGILS